MRKGTDTEDTKMIDAQDREDFIRGAWSGMLFTAGCYSDNPNAPSRYDADSIPEMASKLRPEAVASLLSDCDGFLSGDGIEDAIRASGNGFESAGTDFHYTRNGHGCGFWDGDYPEPGATVLDEWARTFGSCELARGSEDDPDGDDVFEDSDGFFEVWG